MEDNRTQQIKDIVKLSYNDKHITHVLSNEKVNEMTQLQQRYPITKLPVCNKCEALGLWGFTKMKEPAGYCERCGTITVKPICYAEYLVQGYDLPDTMSAEKKEEIKVKRSLIV